MQVPYPQQPGVPVAYAAGAYQGYNPLPVQPQPGMPAAPYPTQYPPPYPTQPIRPPPYQETVAGKERRGERGTKTARKKKRNRCVVQNSADTEASLPGRSLVYEDGALGQIALTHAAGLVWCTP